MSVFKNSLSQTLLKVLSLFLGFVTRTIFIRTLGIQYNGVNGLFHSVLTVLSLGEMGIGTAIAFALYKPVSERDNRRIAALMNFYRSAYRLIAAAIFLIGLCLIPFLRYIVRDVPGIKENITVIYGMFLLKTAVSYLLVYSYTLLVANRRGYTADYIAMTVQIISALAECAILLLTRQYLFYLSFALAANLLQNLWIFLYTERAFPELKEEKDARLPKKDARRILGNVRALLLTRLCNVTLGTDNIIISTFVGTTAVGMLSNYTLITEYISSFLSMISSAILPNFGNITAEDTRGKQYEIFREIEMLFFWLSCFIFTALLVLMNPFIRIWIGEDKIMGGWIVLLLAANLYIRGMTMALTNVSNANGLFAELKGRNMAMAAINIITSVALVRPLGIAGVLAGTVLCRVCTQCWYDPALVYRVVFGRKSAEYFIRQVKYLAVTLTTAALTVFISETIAVRNGCPLFLAKGLVCAVLPNLAVIAVFGRTSEFRECVNRIRLLHRG